MELIIFVDEHFPLLLTTECTIKLLKVTDKHYDKLNIINATYILYHMVYRQAPRQIVTKMELVI